ncbi:MAG: hypothetical protein NTW86_22475 [Candidatus Sumerlaeota bacterium]|nr:hypothetical protein [Candidatus Sumerlaeota bacterium]
MFGSKAAVDPFDELLDAAQAIVAEREKVLGDILAAESNVADADGQVLAAGARVASEEYAAAQEAGGLAVASKGALAAVAAADLAAKSCRLRLQGLRTKRAGIEADLGPAWERLEGFRDDVFRQRAAELSEQFNAVVDSFRGLICKASALRRHAGGHRGERYGYHIGAFNQMLLFNPITNNGSAIRGAIFSGPDGKNWSLDQHWDRDLGAASLDAAIQSIDDRISPIGAVVALVRPEKQG